MLSQELLDVLVCPACKGDLLYEKDPERLICQACRLAYPVKEDIPVMLVDEAEQLDAEGGAESGAGTAPAES